MESLNLNKLSDVSEAVQGPSSPILSNSKISRRVMVNRKLKKGKSRTKFVNLFQHENVNNVTDNNVPENRIKTVEQLEKERKMYYDMICRTTPNFKMLDFEDPDLIFKKPEFTIRQNEKPPISNEKGKMCSGNMFESASMQTTAGKKIEISDNEPEFTIRQNEKPPISNEKGKMCSGNMFESASMQTAAGKKIEISDNIINEHRHIFDDIFNEGELANPVVLKCPLNTNVKKISKIPVFHRNVQPKGNNTLPKIEEQPVQFDKPFHLSQTTKEIICAEIDDVGISNQAEASNAKGLLETGTPSVNEQNVVYTESLSSINTMNKLYSNQQFEDCSSSTNSLENLLYNNSFRMFEESNVSTELSHMYSTTIENPGDLESFKNGITHSNLYTELSTMDNDSLSGMAEVTNTNAIETNPFVEIKFTNVDHKYNVIRNEEVNNAQHTNKTMDCNEQSNIENDGELNLESTNISHHIPERNTCHGVNDSDNAQNKVSAISNNVQCNINSLVTDNLVLNYKQLLADNKERAFEDQQNSICSSKSVININIPSNAFNCKEQIHSKNLIELHRNRNFIGFSEDSTSNMDYKLSEHSTKVRKRTLKAQKKMMSEGFVGFDKNTQKIAKEQAIVYVNNIEEVEKEIHNTELIIQSRSKEEKKMRDRKNKKHKSDHGDEKDNDDRSLCKDVKIKSDKKRKEKEKPKQSNLKVVKEVCKNAIKEVTINEKMNRTVTYDRLSVTSEQSSKKYKEHKKRKSTVTDKEVVQEHKNQIIELSPNQKKFKIEIDCNNKFHINICCNAVQNTCDKEAIKHDKEYKYDVESIGYADAKLNPKIGEGTTAKAMFKSASGKDILLTKKLLNDAEKKFVQFNSDLNTCEKGMSDLQTKEVNTDTNNCEPGNSRGNEKDKLLNKFINKASKLYHDITKLDYQQDKKLEKGKEISSNVSTAQKPIQVCQGALPNNLCGFKSASGNRVKISEKALKTARKMYQDIDNSINNTHCNKDNLSGKANNDAVDTAQKEKRKTRVLYTDMENTNCNTRPQVPCGYGVISEKLVKDVEKSKTASKEERAKLPLDIATKDMPCGFQSASGKHMKISANALEKAKRILDASYAPAGDSSNQVTVLSDFRSTCGTKPTDLNKQFQTKQTYENCDTRTLCMGDFEKSDLGNIADITDDRILSVNNTTSRKAFEYLEDVAETVDCALEKIKKDRLQRSSRRRLGISRCRQINISREKIDQAKKLFSNESFADNLRDASVVITPKRSQIASSSTPLRSTAEFKSDDFFKNVFESEITPIKATAYKKEADIINTNNSPIVIQNRTPGTLDDWYGTVLKQINLLRDTLRTLEDRKCAMEKQMSFVHYGSKEHRKQNSGILFSKRSFNNERIPLKALEINGIDSNNNVEDTILKLTPKNANMMHFNFTGLVNASTTQDGAIIIPNIENLVGLSEIEMAFQTMVGVDPNLIPKGWIANHYRLIVWKLASYERFAFRQLHGVLSVENVIQQLKYRYDREIDKAQRPAIRKILEKDDAPQKRMILCVSDIVEVFNSVELELTDGWYCIRTIIDEPLTREINRKKIKIGTKLIVYGAQLLNCDGCHPLEITDVIKLKIHYNCTRRAVWYAKLGYQRYPEPFTVPLSSIHPRGGVIGCLKLHVLRVYPMRYMEQVDNMKVWRNKKAEEKYANTFENDRLEKIEKIHYSVQENYDREMGLQNKYIEQSKLNQNDVLNITCPKTLYKLLESSNDPDSWLEILLPSQRVSILEYRQQICLQREQEISKRISEEIKKLKLNQRKVTPVLKLLVLENSCDSENIQQFSIWHPKEDDISLLKEGSSFVAYNVVPGSHGCLSSNSKTCFKASENSAPHIKFKRQLFPIAMTLDPYCKPLLNEFDTIGLVVQFSTNNHHQVLWVTETTGIMLCVTIKDGPAICSLLDGITKGKVVSLVNLVYCKPEKEFGQAFANQFTIISTCPQPNYLRDGIELFKMKLPEDTVKLIRNCEQNIEKYTEKINLKQNFAVTSFVRSNNFSDTMSDILDIPDDGTITSSRLTPTDVAMSLIDIDKFT